MRIIGQGGRIDLPLGIERVSARVRQRVGRATNVVSTRTICGGVPLNERVPGTGGRRIRHCYIRRGVTGLITRLTHPALRIIGQHDSCWDSRKDALTTGLRESASMGDLPDTDDVVMGVGPKAVVVPRILDDRIRLTRKRIVLRC